MRLKFFDYLVLLAILIAGIYVNRGFFFPDPFVFRGAGSGLLSKLLMVVQYGFPLVILVVIALYIALRLKKIELSSLLIAIVGLLLGAVVMYLPASYFFYEASKENRVASYHPYLQLAPLPFALHESDSQQKPFRIFFIGGSSTAWPDSQNVDWPGLVQGKLRDKTSRAEIETYNAAREWYNSQHALYNYASNLRKYKPDAIVIMHAINDLIINADFSWISAGSFQEDYRHYYGPLARMIKKPGFFASITEKVSSAWYHTPREIVEQTEFPGLIPFKRNLKTLAELAQLDGTRVVFMTEPYLYKASMTEEEQDRLTMLNYSAIGPEKRWSVTTALRGMEIYSSAIQQVADETNSGFFDLAERIPRSLQYIRDDVHYTDEAFPLLAEEISNGLIPLLFAGEGNLSN